jgi:chemotaxis protein CheY-P-specific phosphatase CheC
MRDLPLTAIQLDAIRELGNVGAGNAATTLSDLLGKTVMIDIPRVRSLSFEETHLAAFPSQAADTHIAVYSQIEGALKGGVYVFFSKKDSLLLSHALLKKDPSPSKPLTPIDISSLTESAYIFCCAYTRAVADLLSLSQKINPVISQITVVEDGRKEDATLIKKFIGGLHSAISIENKVTVEELNPSRNDGAGKINLSVIFFLETESAKKALEILGL